MSRRILKLPYRARDAGADAWPRRSGATLWHRSVGLGQSSGGFGEVSDLPGVDDDDGELSTAQSAGDITLESAGGLQHDQSGAQLVEPLNESLNTGFVVETDSFSADGRIATSSRVLDIETNKDGVNFQISISSNLVSSDTAQPCE